MARFHLRPLIVGLAAALLVGCQQDEIRTYDVPKAEKTRLLGAILPHGDSTWFFKLSGPASAVADQQKAFDAFLRSLHFEGGDRLLLWSLPESWHEEKGERQNRYATIRLGSKDQPLELSVTQLGNQGQAANVLANVNRWRNQLALPALTEEELAKTTTKLEQKGDTITVVDITGTGSGKTAMGPPMAGAARPRSAAKGGDQSGIAYRAPESWKKAPNTSFSKLAFEVREGAARASITVTPLSEMGGGLVQNVNRWRDQLGLPAASEAEVQKLVQEIPVAGKTGQYVDLTGGQQRILGVRVVEGGTSWFVKLIGPVDLVGKQKANFEAFVRSLRFDGGPGGNDG